MSVEHERLKEILAEAAGKATPEARAAYLDTACQGDAELRRQVEALLSAHERAGDFLEQSVIAPEEPIGAGPGTVVGRYKLLEQIGEGGFGRVFMAEQQQPVHRKVALKIVKVGMDTREVVARFEAERQALALMDHPNIARVLDGGATESGRPYFVMELVRGIPITEYCDQHQLPTSERLQLFMKVCAAVQHAHQKGIIHRDLKPTNILVTVIDGHAVPKIIDFGVAKALGQKLTEKTLFTSFQQMIGTPTYMSPEQAALSGVDVDTRSDIYSLGVLLYELLTGQTPFDPKTLAAAGLEEMRRIIRETEPPRPSTRLATALASTPQSALRTPQFKEVRGDLDWIVMKALEKDRARRYDTATALAEDLQHHLNHQPVRAGPPGTAYRARKFIRRHRFGVAMATTLTLALAVGLTAALIGFGQARRERDRAQRLAGAEAAQRLRAEADERKAEAEASKSRQVARFLEDMLEGVGPAVARGRDTKMLREILDKTAERVSKDLKGQPEVEAELEYTMARVYWALSAYDKAEALHRSALSNRRRLWGNEHPDVAASLYEVARVVEIDQRPAEAEPLYREALAIRKKVLGNEHLDVATSLRGLASALEFQGKLDEAEAGSREALAMRRKLLGDEHLDVANSLNGLAYTLGKEGKLDDAELFGREALAMRRRLFVTDHPDLAMSMSALAQILTWKGKIVEAETLFRESLEMRRRLLGNEHDLVYGTLVNLGKSLLAQGKLAEAESTFRELLEGKARLLEGKAGWMLIDCAVGLTEVLKREGRLAEIVTWYEDSRRLNLLAWFLATGGNPDARDGPAAVLIAEKAAAVTGRKAPAILDTLSAAYAEAGQFTNAAKVQKEAIALLKDDEKKKDYASRLSLYESGIPYHDPTWLNAQIGRLPRAGKFAEAEPLLREYLAICEKQTPGDWVTFHARSLLGGSLLGQKKYAEAEPLLLSCCEGMKQREGKIPAGYRPRLKKALERLVELYDATDRTNQAAEWRQKLAEYEKAETERKPSVPPPK